MLANVVIRVRDGVATPDRRFGWLEIERHHPHDPLPARAPAGEWWGHRGA